jgi:predicted GTPase
LGQLRPFRELNILILGETGVEKSTWINSFANFMTYDSLQEASKHDLYSLHGGERY